MYEIVHSMEDGFARTCHKCEKIILGKEFRKVDKITRFLILEHEKEHARNRSSKLIADVVGIMKTRDKFGTKVETLFSILRNYRTKEEMEALKEFFYE